ncbi:MAG: hypothetical protein QM747_03275 [Nocardioides sp.]
MAKMTQAVADQAARIGDDHQKAVDRIMNDASLSVEGKQRAAAKIHLAAVEQMQTLKTNFQGGAVISAQELGKQLFGADQVTGADAISMRDAHDRAAQIEGPQDAIDLLNSAQMYGDDHLARAVAHRAYNESQTPLFGPAWMPVVETYAANRPQVAQKLQDYHDARSQTTADNLAAGMAFYLSKPPILDRFHDHQIAALAGEGE